MDGTNLFFFNSNKVQQGDHFMIADWHVEAALVTEEFSWNTYHLKYMQTDETLNF